MSDVQKNIISRRTVYKFDQREVPATVLEIAFEAARHAPNHKHTHPWKFYVLGQEARSSILPEVKRLAELKSLRLGRSSSDEGMKKAIAKITSPPILIVVTSARTNGDKFREMEDYAATVCAIHNLTLSLWDQGVGLQWSTGGITRSDYVYDKLGISKGEEKIIGFLKVGYPASVPNIQKKPLKDIRLYLK
tara:strand:- start:36 stop:608 length:573 start_codon:yes stop_codon:yes gene_type:complete